MRTRQDRHRHHCPHPRATTRARFASTPALLLATFALAAAFPLVAAKARVMTPAEFQASVLAQASSDDPTSHLVEFFAPWCGHCRKLAPTYDEVADELERDGAFVVVKIDAADDDTGGPAFARAMGVPGFPAFRLFKGDRAFEFRGKDRSKRTLLDFARTRHESFTSQAFVVSPVVQDTAEDTDNTAAVIKLLPKPLVARVKDGARDAARDVIEDVIKCVKETPLAAVVIAGTSAMVALISIIATEHLCDFIGIPRRGESWDDLKRRSEWTAMRYEEMEREKAAKAEQRKKREGGKAE